MGQEAFEFMKPIGPTNGSVAVITVTTSSVHVDLTGASYTTLKAAIDAGRLITLKADGTDVYYRWSPNASGDTIDETMLATGGTPANQAGVIFNGERGDESPPPQTQGILVKATSIAGKLRIHISSKDPSAYFT